MRLKLREAINRMGRVLEKGKLAIFVGSGISVPSGLPTWDGLLLEFVNLCKRIEFLLPPEQQQTEVFDNIQDQIVKYPARVATVVKRRILHVQNQKPELNVEGVLKRFLNEMFSGKQPNKYHELIVSTNYPYIITTNYDDLLEKAAREKGYTDLWLSSFSFNDAAKVASALYEGRPAIIHAHGDLNSLALDDFVFTAEDYVRIRKKYPGFTMALQSIFMNYSVLFVGYGGSDPHLEDFVEEMRFLFKWSDLPELPLYFLTLREDKVSRVLEKYKETLRTDIIVLENYNETTELLTALQKISPREVNSA